MPGGFDVRAAFAREADIYTRTWPSDNPAVPTAILPLLAESVGPEVGSLSVSTVDDDNQSTFPRIANEAGAGELLVEARYSGLEFLLAAALGFEAKRIGSTVMPEALGGGAFRHLIEIDRDLLGQAWFAGEGWVANDGLIAGQQKLRRGTFVVDKSVLLWETRSAMLLGLQINGNANALVTMRTSMVGHDTSLGTRVGTDLSGLLCDTERIMFTDMIFRAAPLDEAPLTDDHIIPEVVGFNVSLNNSLSTILTKDTGKFPDELSRTRPLEISGGFALPSYKEANDDLSFLYQTGQELIGMFEFVGAPIGASGEDFTFRVWLPSMKITNVNIDVQGPSQIQQNYLFNCGKPSSTPSGFPANVKNGAMMIELINDVSGHPLIT